MSIISTLIIKIESMLKREKFPLRLMFDLAQILTVSILVLFLDGDWNWSPFADHIFDITTYIVFILLVFLVLIYVIQKRNSKSV